MLQKYWVKGKQSKNKNKDEQKNIIKSTDVDAMWNQIEFYWFDKLLFYRMQVYYTDDFLPFGVIVFCFIIGKLS